jgi:hypothetical protein
MIVAAGRMLEIVQIVCLSFVKMTTKLYLKLGATSLCDGKHLCAIFNANSFEYLGNLVLRKYQLIARW